MASLSGHEALAIPAGTSSFIIRHYNEGGASFVLENILGPKQLRSLVVIRGGHDRSDLWQSRQHREDSCGV